MSVTYLPDNWRELVHSRGYDRDLEDELIRKINGWERGGMRHPLYGIYIPPTNPTDTALFVTDGGIWDYRHTGEREERAGSVLFLIEDILGNGRPALMTTHSHWNPA